MNEPDFIVPPKPKLGLLAFSSEKPEEIGMNEPEVIMPCPPVKLLESAAPHRSKAPVLAVRRAYLRSERGCSRVTVSAGGAEGLE